MAILIPAPSSLVDDGIQPPAARPAPSTVRTNTLAIDTTEFRLGWRIVVVAMLGLAVNASASFLYAFGTLVIPLQKAFGWQRADLQWGISFLFGGAVVSSQLIGWLNLRYGMKRVTCASLVALSATFLAMTQMGASIGWFYFFCAALPIASLGTIHVTWTHLVNLWFERNRGLSLALVLSGTGVTAALLPSGVTWAIDRFGWQAAFVLLAALPVALVLPLALRWMTVPKDAAPLPVGKRAAAAAAGNGAATRATAHAAARGAAERDAATGAAGHDAAPSAAAVPARSGVSFAAGLRSPRYWCLNIALSLVVAAIVTMVSSTVPLLRDKGLSAATAGAVFGSFGLSLIGGRVVVGYLVDRVWAPAVAAVALSMPAIGCGLLGVTGPTETGLLVAATMLVGIGAGAEFDIAAYLVSRYFGMRDYGRLFGVHLSLITLASALAPWLTGTLYKSTGSYATTLAVCGGAFLAGALLLLPLGRYPKFDRPEPA